MATASSASILQLQVSALENIKSRRLLLLHHRFPPSSSGINESQISSPRRWSALGAKGGIEVLPTDDETVSGFSGCKGCGREEIEKGCNGEGRIEGGIGSVPGFNWWPIKAYRPCPGYLASGGRYRRSGQSMDEVISGTDPNTPA
ncbi:hypothetical protein M569_01095 [Genlisea aurea]|uniref:Uncharacterized protein n=1 Tax=Genlisea aurea TaxID=192259 RepID=S8ELW3_9LAMI|nr:hypothetical protein M569_01095 [Genlisea aurea]